MPQTLVCNKIANYFPLSNGEYDVKPGLFPLQHDFGNSKLDSQIFQLDQQFSKYRKNKLEAHREKLSKYFCTTHLSDSHQQYITRHITETLCHEYSTYFNLSKDENNLLLDCKLTNESFLFSHNYELKKLEQSNYSNLLDAVMMQIQEDIAVITGDDYISCLHLMAPNFWSAENKIGQTFSTIHQDVVGIEKITKNTKTLINAMIHKGPFVRFAWGISTDDKLNHHPQNNVSMNESGNEAGRCFDVNNPGLFLRVERQTINGLPEIKSALFTIRTYLYNIEELSKNEIHSIISAIASMTEKQLIYKGLNTQKRAIINWLTSLL